MAVSIVPSLRRILVQAGIYDRRGHARNHFGRWPELGSPVVGRAYAEDLSRHVDVRARRGESASDAIARVTRSHKR